MTNRLEQWLSWNTDSFEGTLVGFPKLTGKAARLYDDTQALDDFFIALSDADEEEIRNYRVALDPVLYEMILHDDGESITKIAKLCDIRGFCYDYELMHPFADWAVECHSIKAIVALIDNDIAVPSEILKYAIERNDIEIARAMLLYDYEIERSSDYVLEIASMLDVAIKVSAPMRDLLFRYFYPLREETGALVLQTALIFGQDDSFIEKLLDRCPNNSVNYMHDDGRRPIDFSTSQDIYTLLKNRGGISGDPDVIRALDFIHSIKSATDITSINGRLQTLIDGCPIIDYILYEASNRNGAYHNDGDLLYQLLYHGFWDAFFQVIASINDYHKLNGWLYSAPFSYRNKFNSLFEWQEYLRVVQLLLGNGICIQGNPISEICSLSSGFEWTSEIESVVLQVLNLYYQSGISIKKGLAIGASTQAGRDEFIPLVNAIFSKNETCINFLIDKGAELPLRLGEPLSFKLCNYANCDRILSPYTLSKLISIGFDINERNNDGYTILHWFCKHANGKLKHVKAALRYGADCHIKTLSSKLPIDLSRESGKDDVAAFLMKFDEADESNRQKLLEEEPSSEDLLAMRIKTEIDAMRTSLPNEL